MIRSLASHRRERGRVKESQNSGKGGDATCFAYEALAFLEDGSNPRKLRNSEITNDSELGASTSAENANTTKNISPTDLPHKKKKSDENKKIRCALGVLKSGASIPTPEPQNNNPIILTMILFEFCMQQDTTI